MISSNYIVDSQFSASIRFPVVPDRPGRFTINAALRNAESRILGQASASLIAFPEPIALVEPDQEFVIIPQTPWVPQIRIADMPRFNGDANFAFYVRPRPENPYSSLYPEFSWQPAFSDGTTNYAPLAMQFLLPGIRQPFVLDALADFGRVYPPQATFYATRNDRPSIKTIYFTDAAPTPFSVIEKSIPALRDITMELASPSDQPTRFSIESLSLTAKEGEDYSLPTHQILFAPGQTKAHFQILLHNDDIYESDEYIELSFLNADSSLSLPPFKWNLLILDDEKPAAPEVHLEIFGDGSLTLRVQTQRDGTYQLEQSDSLVTPHWEPVGVPFPHQGNSFSREVLIPLPAVLSTQPTGFYRVRTL